MRNNNPINFMKLTTHFFEQFKKRVAEDIRPDAYKELLNWVQTGPIVCKGHWYVLFTHFTMVGTDGNATDTITKRWPPFAGSIEIKR